MSAKALVEVHDVIRVWIEMRAPRKGELTWSVPADASPGKALEHVLMERDIWASGEAGFGCRAFREVMPEFEDTDEGLRIRNIVVHVEHLRTAPAPHDITSHTQLL